MGQWAALTQQLDDALLLLEDRPPLRLRRVRGEHELDVLPDDRLADPRGRHALRTRGGARSGVTAGEPSVMGGHGMVIEGSPFDVRAEGLKPT